MSIRPDGFCLGEISNSDYDHLVLLGEIIKEFGYYKGFCFDVWQEPYWSKEEIWKLPIYIDTSCSPPAGYKEKLELALYIEKSIEGL